MAQAIPLVRAMALLPSLKWMQKQGLAVEDRLAAQGLANLSFWNPMRPVPLLKAGGLLQDIARDIGPDAACRIVSETEDRDLLQIGRVALGTATPVEALTRISFALPYFCSHELLTIEADDSDFVVRHAYGARFDAETLHLMCQYALAVLDRICAMSGAARHG